MQISPFVVGRGLLEWVAGVGRLPPCLFFGGGGGAEGHCLAFDHFLWGRFVLCWGPADRGQSLGFPVSFCLGTGLALWLDL